MSISHGIIGAAGDMGKSLLNLLSDNDGRVVGVDTSLAESDWDALWKSDVIWLAISRNAVDGVIGNRRILSSQLVIDICSLKRGVSTLVTSSGATHLSLHPMHGPNIRRDRQKW